ncbi:hypothetical protein [Lacticaseibacillus hulanensis]|uniref:hypothetical protein n=1 Tax=Lacticaseibacillus hulanensis TaxID=2493111 RepID=UPI000FD9AC59|nr:hypothetical protein [Lacticaseibacillus hulanensis]
MGAYTQGKKVAGDYDSGWQKITLTSAVTQHTILVPMMRKIGNEVQLKGAINMTAPGTIATLPYKPVDEFGFNCSQLSTTPGQNANVYLETDGTLQLIYASTYEKGVWLNEIHYFIN